MNAQIITSFLDTDLYKLTMLQAFWDQYPYSQMCWKFTCRNKGVKLGFLSEEILQQLDYLYKLKITDDEADYLLSLGFFKKDFVDYLRNEFFFRPDVIVENINDELVITVKGAFEVNLFEVYVLAIVNEIYFDKISKANSGIDYKDEGHKRLLKKIEKLKEYPDLVFAEFGTRRRFSKHWQESVVSVLKLNCKNIIGTSNVYLAKKYGLKPIGTVAHEWTMAHLGFVERIEKAQGRALHVWQQEYGNRLGIALSDTFTTDAFLRDFTFILANSYDGVRHDSGDPIIFGYKIINHYISLGIDPLTKTIVFSDGLDIDKAISIFKEFQGKIKISFGIGTNLSNDVGLNALNIVMKLTRCNYVNCVKLSDNSGKEMGEPYMINSVKEAYEVR